MIKRLSTAAIGVALIFSATSVEARPYFGFDGRTYGEPAKAPNWGRPQSNVPRVADDKGAPRKCLTSAVHAVLDKIEARFGPVKVISTCRPGARIAGSGRISRHASGNAVDFETGNRKGAIINWLVANHKTGGTMTYADMSHIHVDVGQHFVSLAGGRKYASNSNSNSNSNSSSSSSSSSSSRRYAEGNSRYDSGYSRVSYEGSRSYGRSRRYAREASYERGHSSGYNDSGTGHYTGGYATIYR
ncbi:MAG TPA: D-Ala-D-Ala carboxypeptidase family metallohydrolase [Hyphomicrobium sp.]